MESEWKGKETKGKKRALVRIDAAV